MSQTSLLRSLLASSFLTLFLAACSSGGGGGGGDTGLQKLTPEQKQAYDAWLKAPIKSCEAMEIMGAQATEFSSPFGPRETSRDAIAKGVDLSILAERTGGSLWIAGAKGAMNAALLSGGSVAMQPGVATSKFESSVSVNGGQEQKVKVETTSSGYGCTVKINDVEVTKVSIAKTVDVAMFSSVTKPFEKFTLAADSVARQYGNYVELSIDRVRGAIFQSLQPVDPDLGPIAGLGYSKDEAKKYFVPVVAPREFAFGLELGHGSPLAYMDDNSVIIKREEAVIWPAAQEKRTLVFRSLFRVAGASIGGIPFGPGGTAVQAVAHKVSIESTPQGYVVEDVGTTLMEPMTLAKDQIDQCVVDRAERYGAVFPAKLRSNLSTGLPSPQQLYQGCDVFEKSLRGRFEQSNLALNALNVLMSGVSPELVRVTGYKFSFGGWESYLNSRVLALLSGSTSQGLVTGREPTLLSVIDENVKVARLATDFPQMHSSYLPSLAWLLQMLPTRSYDLSKTNSWIQRFVAAAAKLGPDFVDPFQVFGSSLPTSAAENQMAYIEAASPSLLAAAREALSEAKALKYDGYLRNVHGVLFSVQPTESFLIEKRDQMRSVRVQLDKYPTLANYRSRLSNLILDKTAVPSSDVEPLFNALAKLADVTNLLVDAYLAQVEADPKSTDAVQTGLWIRAMASGDADLIRDYLTQMAAAGFQSEGAQTVREMVKTHPTSVQLKAQVDAVGLAAQFVRADRARAQASRYDVFAESNIKDLGLKMIAETFTAADIASLETFAQIAAKRLMCANYQSVSARLNCAGLERFSKAAGKLLSAQYEGRFVTLATKVQGWMGRLQPGGADFSMVDTLNESLFDSGAAPAWTKCSVAQIDVQTTKLEQAVQDYFAAGTDMMKKFTAQNAARDAVNAHCP